MLKRSQIRAADDRGFTLVELMVVVLVIAIRIAIAIPTFLGARQRAQDRAAQSILRNGILAIQLMLDDNGRAVPNQATMITELGLIEPSITWVNHTTDAQESSVTISLDDEPTFATGATGSRSGNCYYVRVYTSGVDDRHVDQTQPCIAHNGEGTASPSGW